MKHSLAIYILLPYLLQHHYYYLNASRDMTLKASQACAACKYQRRRCTSDCPLAPYFPADQPKLFQNAHKLFGRSNILDIIRPMDAERRAEAMRSIIYEANIRDRFPVHGCWGIICQLRYQIWQADEELRAVHAQLDMYRQQHYQQQVSTLTDNFPSQLELGMATPNDNALSLFNHNPQPCNAIGSPSNNSFSSPYMDAKDLWGQHSYATNNNGNSMAIQSPLVASIYQSSSEESLKATTQQSFEHVAENELKTAAAMF